MKNMRLWTALLLILGLAAPAVAQDDSQSMRRTVSVSGEGEVRVEPDQATIRFGVVTEADDPETARQRNAEASKNALNAVRALDVPERKIRMETLQLQPRREYNEQTRRYEERGYEAIRTVVVELEDLEKLPTLIARVVQQGANRLQGVQYGLQDEDQARAEALREAVQNARAKAEIMTGAIGASVGPVQQINEQSFSMPMPFVRMEQAAMSKTEDAAPEPEAYAAGEIAVNAVVQVVFALQ